MITEKNKQLWKQVEKFFKTHTFMFCLYENVFVYFPSISKVKVQLLRKHVNFFFISSSNALNFSVLNKTNKHKLKLETQKSHTNQKGFSIFAIVTVNKKHYR